jgi:hypothetical protein
MDKGKGYHGYVLLLINAAQKISAAAPLRVMASRYNPYE